MGPTDLWELVRRLNKTERDRVKRFGKMAGGDGEMLYLLLFEDLILTDKYESDKRYLASHPKAPYAKTFSKNKQYLYQTILDALRSQRQYDRAEKPRDFQIRELIENAHLLKQKMLFPQAFALLEKARREAERYQFLELLLEVLRQMRTHLNEHPGKDYQQRLEEALDLIQGVGKQIDLNCHLLRLRDRLFMHVRGVAIHRTALDSSLEEEIEAMRLRKPAQSPSTEAKTNYHLTLALHEAAKGNLVQAWRHHRAVFLLWQSATDFREVRVSQYLKLLNNYLTTSIAARKTVQFIRALELLERSAGPSNDERAESKQNTVFIRLQYFLSAADWDNCLLIEKEFKAKADWVTTKMRPPRLLAFYLSFARLHFVLDHVAESQKYLMYLDGEHLEGVHDDKLAEAKVMGILLQYGKLDVVKMEPQVRSAKRALQRNANTPPYLILLLKGIAQVMGLPQAEQRLAWEGLAQKVQSEVGVTTYDGGTYLFLGWLKAQVEGRNLWEVF